MAPRHKKEDTGELMVSLEQYSRTRDSVILALTNLQAGLTNVQTNLNDLFRAYMQHTTSILAGEDGDMDKFQLPANITATANAAMEAATTAASGINQVVSASNQVTEGAAADGKNKKRKREKKEKDPNAPKKPLTAAFLYAQTARPIVRADLEAALEPGAILEKNAVNLEVTKRWNELPDEEKERWKASYRSSMEDYKIELAEYLAKAGGKVADVHIDEDLSDAEDVEMADVGTVDSDASSEDEEEPPVVVKAPSPPAKTPRPNKRQKTVAAAATNGAAVPSTPAPAKDTPVPIPSSSRPTTQVPAPVPASSVEAPAAAKKDSKKKAKLAAPAPIAPAPAKEATPDDTSKTAKKAKSSRSTRGAEAEIDKENAAAGAGEKKKEKRDRSKRKSEVAST
ncbi:hypothetical protein HBH98_217440 [Parastagonospora nodorum]|nr:hypothetical protein HBH50_144730 [Parastagonospora nodorum]KAH4086023.1 hypothetical protein HBH48_145140 [Parastagonospora nodorum]KAH4337778.1 hypothetical protein HBH98_217440 [Parastagonospora nodorum]KAH4365408.1 hypothetical protein HBH97_171930 [Parastagonospora nodorum]KAH4411169.1 hypothetical protein HBH99_069770 [Parastagonospora nodorum]